MTSALAGLEPKEVWKHFDALAAIPRASTKEAAARDYVVAQATRLGLEVTHDQVGNTVIRKPARPGREGTPIALLQGHLDMVCEKNEGTAHNFDTDPIEIVRDGDWLKAAGTTLGADNGVGVASALAVMESTDIAHGPLEFLFTIDEESGLTGAAEFPGGILKSKFFLNLDNEETGTICIGCAGGIKTTGRRKVRLLPATAKAAWRIKVSGLKGGPCASLAVCSTRYSATILSRLPKSMVAARRTRFRAKHRPWYCLSWPLKRQCNRWSQKPN
jgi:dipeptidase D